MAAAPGIAPLPRHVPITFSLLRRATPVITPPPEGARCPPPRELDRCSRVWARMVWHQSGMRGSGCSDLDWEFSMKRPCSRHRCRLPQPRDTPVYALDKTLGFINLWGDAAESSIRARFRRPSVAPAITSANSVPAMPPRINPLPPSPVTQ